MSGLVVDSQLEASASLLKDEARFRFGDLVRSADVLLIVPPFAALDRPSLAAHLLQACARVAGVRVSVLYANVILAAMMGEEAYEACSGHAPGIFLGERFFARAAYGVPPFGRDGVRVWNEYADHCARTSADPMDVSRLRLLETHAAEWADSVAAGVAALDFRIIGCTTTFEQTAASVALLNRIKPRCRAVTIIGGANCEGEMAEGIASLGAAIDYVFSGECETAFPAFLTDALRGVVPSSRVVYGQPCNDLDALPMPHYAEFFEQRAKYLPPAGPRGTTIWLPYESSRGCWWGQKHHCTFCGLNGTTMQFRQRSPERVLADLKLFVETYPSRHVAMADNIMPYSYFGTLIPRLPTEVPDVHIFYEQKANLTLHKVLALKKAGVTNIQPGIEALSSPLLRLMKKGVSAPQNIALLRYVTSADMSADWNILYGFPGDRLCDYEQTLLLLPLMRHLYPPSGVWCLSIDRFSPYFGRPEEYQVTNLRPHRAYTSVLPGAADVAKVAYHFAGDYASESRANPRVIDAIRTEVNAWRRCWFARGRTRPALRIHPVSEEMFLLLDTRDLPGTKPARFLNRQQALVALVGRRIAERAGMEWALDSKIAVELDGMYVPLATAEPELLLEFEAQASQDQHVEPHPDRSPVPLRLATRSPGFAA